MALKINAGNLVTNRYLIVQSDGVKFCETTLGGRARHFRYHEIQYLLMAADHVLSFQVGKEVFSIPTIPGKKKHDEVISALISQVQLAHPELSTD
jgi:hypothetical protein